MDTPGYMNKLKALFLMILLSAGISSNVSAATITVTSTGDSGPGTLRNAISTASAGDTIVFNLTYPATITLSSQLVISCLNLTITGPGADKLTINGNNLCRVFYVNSGVTVTIQGITVANGNADNGGGLLNDSGTVITVNNSTFSGNHASVHGGGLYNDGGTISVIDSTISNNTAVWFGGAVENDVGEMTISGSTIIGNSSGVYGGIDNYGTMEVLNSTIYNNTSTYNCGPSGIFNSSPADGALEIINSTIVGNRGNVGNGDNCYGGGTGDINFKNSIVADSIALSNCAVYGGFAAGTTNNISTDDSCGIAGFTQKSTAELALGPVQDNGGPTQTIALLAGSAAIDAADDTSCPSVDQRGVTRPKGPHCDIGAYELSVTVDLISSVNPSSYGQSVTFTATVLEHGSIPTGTVIFRDGGSEICSGVPLSSGVATCIRSSLSRGDHTISAEFIGDSGSSGSDSLIQTVNKANQTITVNQQAPPSAAFNASLTVSATASSGLDVAITTSGSCSGNGTASAVITMTSGTGTCTVKYDQAGDGTYDPAPQVTESTNAQKAGQAITIDTPAPETAVYNTSFTVAATGGGSGNPVTYSSEGACTNVGATFTMTSGTGTCTVKYDQAGSDNYNAAPQVTEGVTANKAGQTITVNPYAPSSAAYNTSFTVAATASSGLGVAITASGACSGSGTDSAKITMSGLMDTCNVFFNQAGDANYNQAPQVSDTTAQYILTVTPLGTGRGSVSGNGIICNWDGILSAGTCSFGFDYNAGFNLSALADECSFLKEWSDACYGTEGQCEGTMTGQKTVAATFDLYPLARLSSSMDGHDTIADVYNNDATEGGVIQIQGLPFSEDLEFKRPIDVTIECGWNCGYTQLNGEVSINSLTVQFGSVTLQSGVLVIKDTIP